jgi:hypothetical protein
MIFLYRYYKMYIDSDLDSDYSDTETDYSDSDSDMDVFSIIRDQRLIDMEYYMFLFFENYKWN